MQGLTRPNSVVAMCAEASAMVYQLAVMFKVVIFVGLLRHLESTSTFRSWMTF